MSEPGDRPEQDGQLRLAIFAFLFAAGILIHELVLERHHAVLSHHTLVWLAAIWCLLKPDSLVRFLAMMAALLVNLGLDMPIILNHSIPCVFIAVAALAQAGLQWFRQRGSFDTGAYFLSLAPIFRSVTLLVYGFAFLAKLNAGFFDPEMSAAPSIYMDVARVLPLPTEEWTRPLIIWATVIVEGAIPLLLLLRRTRVAGVLLAVPFHIMLAFGGHGPFSGFALAFLFPFLPDDFPTRLRLAVEKLPGLIRVLRTVSSIAVHPVTFAVLAGLSVLERAARDYAWLPESTLDAINAAGHVAFFPYAVGCLIAVIAALRQPHPAAVPTPPVSVNPVLWVVAVLLTVLNGLCPYLGLKTQHSFTMYSNLRTEGDQWNHLLMPSALRVFPFQNDLVTIIDSSDPKLKSDAGNDTRWVFFEFHRYVSARPDISVTFEYQGERRTVNRVGADPLLGRRPPYIMRKLLYFRPVLPPGRNVVQH